MDELKIRKKNLIMFPLGTVGRDMMYYLFTSCIITYVMFTRSLTNAQFAAITGIVVAARIFDALNDPIMGNIIERTRTRWGKYKPWLLIGIVATSIVIYLAFNTDLQGWSFVWFFGVIYFMYSITYTMHDISYWGMVPALTSDADARNQFTSRATLCAGIGGTLASVLIPMLTVGGMTIGGNTKYAYGVIALAISIIAPLFLCFTIFGVKDRRDYTEAPPLSFKKIWKTISGNDQLVWISLIFLIQQISNGFIVGGIGATYIYFDFGYNGGLFSLFTIAGMLPTAFLMIFYPAISRKVGRKALMRIMIIVSTVGYALILIAGVLLGGQSGGEANMMKFYAVTLGYALSNFGNYCFYLVMMISIMNTVEYNEYKNGVRDEAIVASMRPFLTKMSSALIVLLTNAAYIVFGITKYTNQISEFENACQRNLISETEKLSSIGGVLANVSHNQTLALVLVMSLIPCALMLASYFIYKSKYKLDEAEYDRICAELEARKAKA